jgi:Flp pilus assembly protein TadD
MAYRAFGRADFATARALADACLELDPAILDCWRLLAEAHMQEGRHEAAVGCLRRLLLDAPDDLYALEKLARSYLGAGRAREAADVAARACAAAPGEPALTYLSGLALSRSGDGRGAQDAFERALSLDPDHAYAAFELAMLHLSNGAFDRGWPLYERRHALDPAFLACEGVTRWTGQDPRGRKLLVTPEGGNGDMIWAARFLPAARALGAEVHLRVAPALAALLSDLEGVDAFAAPAADPETFDLWCPMLSLPGNVGATDPARYPPARLHARPMEGDRLARLLERGRGRLRVGIVWSGSEDYGNNRHRAARLTDFLPLAELPSVQLYSLQKGAPRAQLLESGLGNLLIDADDHDFAETAALVQALDLVVMTDSALAHLAGSLGTPVWVLLDANPYWYHGRSGDRSDWYPSMRYFRQDRPGDWAGVVNRVVRTLADLAG